MFNILAIGMVFLSLFSFSQSEDKDKNEPIYIHGDNGIEIDRIRREIRAFKHAYVKRGSTTLYGDVLYGYYAEDKRKKLTLTRAEAIGNVKITMPDKTLRAREGTYDLVKDVLVFRGDVQVTEKENHLKGPYATMDRKTGHTTILNYDPLDSKKPSIGHAQNQVRVLLGGEKPAQ